MDGLCAACTFKQHCPTPGTEELDKVQLGIFEDTLGHLALSDETLEVPARTEKGSLVTTAGIVRRVMGYFAAGGEDYALLYRDALRRRTLYGNVFGGPDQPEVELYNLAEQSTSV